MALEIPSAVKFLPTLGGLTDWTFASAVAGHVALNAAGITNGATVRYYARDPASAQWELGSGLYDSATNKVTRVTIHLSSTGVKVNFSSIPQVGLTFLGSDLIPPALPGFFAHKNGVDQTAPALSNYVPVTFSTTTSNVGGYFNTTTSLWTPPAGRVIMIMQALFTSAAAGNYECYIVKNADTTNGKIAFGRQPLLSGQVLNTCSTIDTANGTDTYQPYVWQNGGGNIYGSDKLTLFTGSMIR